jgi:hypothetical protein
LCEWLKNKQNFKASSNTANQIDADRYVNEAGLQSLICIFPEWTSEEISFTQGHALFPVLSTI